MLKDQRNLLWLVPLAALLTMPLWKPFAADILSPARQGTPLSGSSLTNRGSLRVSEMSGVQFEQSKNGSKEWFITASSLYSTEEDSSLQLEDVQGLFFGSAGTNVETRFRSQKARYNEDINMITLQGRVVIENNKGYEMHTESLEYLAAEKTIKTTSAVNIRGSNFEVSGDQLLYDTAKGNYRLAGNVVCNIW